MGGLNLRVPRGPSKKREEFTLPELHRPVVITPRDRIGNETVIIRKGEFIDSTSILLIFKSSKGSNCIECFLKSDFLVGIYRYKYIEDGLCLPQVDHA